MKTRFFLIVLVVTTVSNVFAQQRAVTLTLVTGQNQVATNAFELKSGYSAELVAHAFDGAWPSFRKNGVWFIAPPQTDRRTRIQGPATVAIYSLRPGPIAEWATFIITPEAYPPDRAIILPEGDPGAEITLECSTNLTHWSTATNGVYTGTNGAKFFRIRADRIP